MYDIEMTTPSEDFIQIWIAAGKHINAQVEGGIPNWFRAHPNPPFLEHLSFGIGNQLFFIRIEDVDGHVVVPGNLGGLHHIAEECRGHACILPMRCISNHNWAPALPGWGLISAITGHPIDPISMVTNSKIEMTPWELHDFAVQVVRSSLDEQHREIMSWCGDPGIDPSVWFIGDNGPEWIIVRAVRYPESEAALPSNLVEIAERCSGLGKQGHFASIAFASSDQPFLSENENPIPLWRGAGCHVKFTGLIKIT